MSRHRERSDPPYGCAKLVPAPAKLQTAGLVAKILWRDAQGIEGAVELGTTEIRIGRALDCAIRTDDAMVSRHHARVYWSGNSYVCEDLSSANGVYYQEQRVGNHLFKHGDAIRCGSLWLRFVDHAGDQASAPLPVSSGAIPQPTTAGEVTVGQRRNSAQSTDAPPHGASFAMPFATEAPTSMSTSSVTASAETELRVVRRRVDQLQAELRNFRANKVSPDNASRLEDLENNVTTLEVERDHLIEQVKELQAALERENAGVKVKRALQIAAKTAETSASLIDLLSSVRIELMAAEGEFDQYANAIPRTSFELIRQSLRDSSAHIDQARELMRQLRSVTES